MDVWMGFAREERLAVPARNRLQIREPDSLKLLQVFICIDKVERIEWSPDSQLLLTEILFCMTTLTAGLLQIWSLRDSEWTCRIYEGLAGVAHARFGDSDTVLVSVEFQLYISIWQLQEGSSAPVARIERPKFAASGVTLSRDGCWLAMLRRPEGQDVTLSGDAGQLHWGPDDSTLVLCELPGRPPWCRLYSLAGECLAQLGDGFPRSVSVSSSTQLLVGCGIDGQLQLLSAVSRRVIANFSHAKSECDKAEVSFWEEDFEMNEPGGLRYRRLQDCVVWIWDLGRMALKSLLKHQSTVKCMAWDPAARGELSRLALSTSDPVLFFWPRTVMPMLAAAGFARDAGIGRLAASEEFLAGLRSLVGPVTSPQLAAQLLRNYWGAQAYANFESLLFEFSEFCQTHGIKMPRQVVVMAVQFASGDSWPDFTSIRSGQMKEMLQYVQKLRREGDLVEIRSAHTAGSIIRAYGTAQDLDGVWATWNDMKLRGVQPTRITLGCMVEALASNDDPEGAYQIIQQALADPHTAHLVNAVTYSSVLKSFNHRKLFHRVWEVYDEMIQQKVEFSVSTYNALLDVCARSGNISRAEPLLKDMADQGVAPSIITFSTVIKAYCAANRLEQAFRIFEDGERLMALTLRTS
eukprot:g19137.t1